MNPKVTIECDAKHEGIVRRALALAEEMEQLALTAPEGEVFGACENAIVDKGRLFQSQVLAEAVARRIETAEKRGHLSEVAPVGAKKKTAATNKAT